MPRLTSTSTSLCAIRTEKESLSRHPRPGAACQPLGTPRPPSDLFVAARLKPDPWGPALVAGVASKVAARDATTGSDQTVTG
jgi:hypothetical protein